MNQEKKPVFETKPVFENYAIIATGGKQYQAIPGKTIAIESLKAKLEMPLILIKFSLENLALTILNSVNHLSLVRA